jgi:DUF4097 and DUF4098 domain-containing protein YvlB
MKMATQTVSRHGFVCWLTLAVGVAQLHAAAISSDLKKTFPTSAGGTLAMEVDRGSITVQTGDRSEVNIEVKRSISGVSESKAEDIFSRHEVTFEQENDRVVVKAKYKSGSKGLFGRDENKLQVKYLVSMPKRFSVDLATAGGNVSISDLDGAAKVRTAGGNIDLAEVTGKTDAQTAGGNIKLKSGGDEAALKTSGGSIEIGKAGGETKASTAGGNISVETAEKKLTAKTSGGNINLGTLRDETEADTAGGGITVKSAEANIVAKSSGGNIRIAEAHGTVSASTAAGGVSVAFLDQPKEDCKLSTSGGDITVSMAENLAFNLEASTGGGNIRTDIPVSSKGEQRSGTLKGAINGGGKLLVLRTSAGRVSIAKLDK